MLRYVLTILYFATTRAQYGQLSRDATSLTLLHQSSAQLNGISDRLVQVESTAKKVSVKLDILDANLKSKDNVAIAEERENKRQLNIIFSKLETLGYSIGGFRAQLETLQKDLNFMKKGYSGVFELVSNAADSQCDNGGGKSIRDTRHLSSSMSQLQSNLEKSNSLLEAIHTSVISLNGKADSSRVQQRRQRTGNSNVKTGEISSEIQAELKYLQHLVEGLSNKENPEMNTNIPRDCLEASQLGPSPSGIYKIQPSRSLYAAFVYCDMDFENGGWTVIQRRYGGQIDFHNRKLEEYRIGFGNVATEYWIGLDSIHELTERSDAIYQLRIEITDFRNKTAVANYEMFAIGGRSKDYQITLLDGFSGTAEDSLMLSQGQPFKIQFPQSSLAQRCNQGSKVGGWWFPTINCPGTGSNLNGRYLSAHLSTELEALGIFWAGFHGAQYSLEKTKMMIRPNKSKVL